MGFVRAHPDLLAATDHPRVLRCPKQAGAPRVGVVTGGGSGHEPAFLGYVGPGLLDAVAIGEVFASPTAKSFHAAFREADGGQGVACLYGNYAGDNMNVKMAVSATADEADKRRGVAGEILMWKAGGARAAEGGDLGAVIGAAQKAIDNTRSIGIGLSACTIPAAGKPNFTIEPGHMELGIGHHGEHGIAVLPVAPAKEMASIMLEKILADLPFEGEDAAVLVSGLGATPLMELYLLYGHIDEMLRARNVTPRLRFVGNYFTSLEMMGVSVTLTRLDSELDRLLRAPARSIGLTVAGG